MSPTARRKYGLMNKHPTNPMMIYVLAAVTLLLFAISFLFEGLLTFEPPEFLTDQNSGHAPG